MRRRRAVRHPDRIQALVAVGAITLAGTNVNTIFGQIAGKLVTPSS